MYACIIKIHTLLCIKQTAPSYIHITLAVKAKDEIAFALNF